MDRAIRWLAVAVGLLAVAILAGAVALILTLRTPAAIAPSAVAPTLSAAAHATPATSSAVVAECDDLQSLMRIEQLSMETTLIPGEYVWLDRQTSPAALRRGDIIAFYPMLDDEPVPSYDLPTPSVKRIIGLPGDQIALKSGAVYVNGVLLTEPYVHGQSMNPLSDQTQWTVEDGHFFVLGDNRNNSADSRSDQIGQIGFQWVIGRFAYVCSPPDKAGPVN